LVVESEKMSLSVVEGGFEDKVDLRLEGVQVFLSGPIEPSDGASQLPNFAVNEIAVEANKSLLYMRDFLLWLSSLPFSVLHQSPIYLALVPYRGEENHVASLASTNMGSFDQRLSSMIGG
jgi:hypothetical protein